MHTRCNTRCDLKVSYAQRRSDRIAFTAPTARFKTRCRCVSRWKTCTRVYVRRSRRNHAMHPRDARYTSDDGLVRNLEALRRLVKKFASRARRRRVDRRERSEPVDANDHVRPLLAMRIFRIARAPPLLKTKDSYAASRSSRALADPSACARSRAAPMTERRASGETRSRRASRETSSTGRERRTDVASERASDDGVPEGRRAVAPFFIFSLGVVTFLFRTPRSRYVAIVRC
jgi:hypothetical protein